MEFINNNNGNKNNNDGKVFIKVFIISIAVFLCFILFCVLLYYSFYPNGRDPVTGGQSVNVVYEIGDRIITEDNLAITITSVSNTDHLYFLGIDYAEDNFVVVNYKIENLSANSIYVSGLDFELVMSGGYNYDYVSIHSDSNDLQPLRVVECEVVFETVYSTDEQNYMLYFKKTSLFIEEYRYAFKLY